MTTASELRSKLESQSEEIGNIAHKIEDRLESYIDWPGLVRQHPLQSFGIAAVAGLFLAGANGPILRGVGKQLGTLAQAAVTASIMSAVNNPSPTQSV
jgi:hypothetical protein